LCGAEQDRTAEQQEVNQQRHGHVAANARLIDESEAARNVPRAAGEMNNHLMRGLI
jgi:hypothetical protein